MNDRDEAELAWWRECFSLRFGPGNLPSPRTALISVRFLLFVDDPERGLYEFRTSVAENADA